MPGSTDSTPTGTRTYTDDDLTVSQLAIGTGTEIVPVKRSDDHVAIPGVPGIHTHCALVSQTQPVIGQYD